LSTECISNNNTRKDNSVTIIIAISVVLTAFCTLVFLPIQSIIILLELSSRRFCSLSLYPLIHFSDWLLERQYFSLWLIFNNKKKNDDEQFLLFYVKINHHDIRFELNYVFSYQQQKQNHYNNKYHIKKRRKKNQERDPINLFT
jgi:hypothetical protein